MKTPYVILTQEQYSALVAALGLYMEQHKEQQEVCFCQACQYARDAKIIGIAQTYAPIFMPINTVWHETREKQS